MVNPPKKPVTTHRKKGVFVAPANTTAITPARKAPNTLTDKIANEKEKILAWPNIKLNQYLAQPPKPAPKKTNMELKSKTIPVVCTIKPLQHTQK